MDAKFTYKFWKELFAGIGTKLAFIMAYHLQTYGHTKRVNRILEDMFKMYVMHQQWKWEDFSYNNGYQESLRMIPFEALYGRICNTSIN